MDFLTFLSEILKALAWPVAAVVIVILFRRELRELLPRLEGFRYREFRADFGRELKELDHDVEEAGLPDDSATETDMPRPMPDWQIAMTTLSAGLDPLGLINQSWNRLLNAMEAALRREGISTKLSRTTIQQELVGAGILPPDTLQVIDRLEHLRQQASDAGTHAVEPNQAQEFVRIVERFIRALHARALPE